MSGCVWWLSAAARAVAREQRDRFEHRLRELVAGDRLAAADAFGEQGGDLGVELGARGADELLARRVGIARVAVGPVVGHRRVGVDDGECAGGDRDLVAGDPERVPAAIVVLVVVEHRVGDVAQDGQLAQDAEADARVQLDDRALVGIQRAGGHQQAVRQREVADVAQQRREHQDVALVVGEVELAREDVGQDRGLGRLAVQDEVAGGQRLEQHPYGPLARLVQVAAQVAVLQGGARVIAERQQQVVLDLLEAAGAVGGEHDAVEAVAQVQRDRHQVLDLAVGGGQLVLGQVGEGIVLADRLVAFEHQAGEPLHDGAVLRIVLEAVREDEVAVAVAVGVRRLEQQSLLGLEQFERGAEDQLAGIRGGREDAAALVQALELGPQLAVELALRAPRLLQPADQPVLRAHRGVLLAQGGLQASDLLGAGERPDPRRDAFHERVLRSVLDAGPAHGHLRAPGGLPRWVCPLAVARERRGQIEACARLGIRDTATLRRR